ncbi:MAG: hypothetical protein HQL63_11160 [Magnetococcales bacterium]|nr:hypothetical protein [Magnetococcales bacterium]
MDAPLRVMTVAICFRVLVILGMALLLGVAPAVAATSLDLPTDDELVKACQELAKENAVPVAENAKYMTQCVQDLKNSLQMEEAEGVKEPVGMPLTAPVGTPPTAGVKEPVGTPPAVPAASTAPVGTPPAVPAASTAPVGTPPTAGAKEPVGTSPTVPSAPATKK